MIEKKNHKMSERVFKNRGDSLLKKSVLVLVKVSQYGLHGTQFREVIGTFQSKDSLDRQIHYYENHHPSDRDHPYHFEILTCPLDFVGDPSYEITKRY